MRLFTKRLSLALILIPSVLYLVDTAFGGRYAHRGVRHLAEKLGGITDWKDGHIRDAYANEIDEAEAVLTRDIHETTAVIADLKAVGATDKAAEMQKMLGHLLDRREQVLSVKRSYLTELNKKQIAIARWEMMKAEDQATKANFASARKILTFEKENGRFNFQAVTQKVSVVVNAFLNAVEDGSGEDVRAYCGGELKARLTSSALKALRKAAPTGDFTLRPAGGGEVSVLFGNEVKLKVAKSSDGEWKVVEARW